MAILHYVIDDKVYIGEPRTSQLPPDGTYGVLFDGGSTLRVWLSIDDVRGTNMYVAQLGVFAGAALNVARAVEMLFRALSEGSEQPRAILDTRARAGTLRRVLPPRDGAAQAAADAAGGEGRLMGFSLRERLAHLAHLAGRGVALRNELIEVETRMIATFGWGVAALFEADPNLDRVELMRTPGGDLDVRAAFGGDLDAHYFCEDGAFVTWPDARRVDAPAVCADLQALHDAVKADETFLAWLARWEAGVREEVLDGERPNGVYCWRYVRETHHGETAPALIPDP